MSQLVSEVLSFSKAALGQTGQGARLELVALDAVVKERIEREKGTALVESTVASGDGGLGGRAIDRSGAGQCPAQCRPLRGGGWGDPDRRDLVRHGKMVVTVADRGPGVAEENLPRLFDAFYRPDASRTRRTGGVGLGLAIVKSCVEACGGEVTVANREGGGLAVSLSFLAPESAQPVQPRRIGIESSPFRGVTWGDVEFPLRQKLGTLSAC